GTWTSTRRLSTERHCKATVPARPLVASAGRTPASGVALLSGGALCRSSAPAVVSRRRTGRQRWDGPGGRPARCGFSVTGATDQPRLQTRVRWFGTQPDGEKRFGEVIAFNRALHRAIDVHLDARARLVRKGQRLTALHIHHPGLQLRNT